MRLLFCCLWGTFRPPAADGGIPGGNGNRALRRTPLAAFWVTDSWAHPLVALCGARPADLRPEALWGNLTCWPARFPGRGERKCPSGREGGRHGTGKTGREIPGRSKPHLVIFLTDLKKALGVGTDGTQLRSGGTDDQMATVAALPHLYLAAGKDLRSFHIV